MIVERINLDLEVGVVVEEGRVAVSGTLELLAHVHDLVFFGANLGFEVLDAGGKLDISGALAVNALLKVRVLVAVLFLESLKMVELVLEADNLVLELNYLTLTLDKLGLLTLEVEGF